MFSSQFTSLFIFQRELHLFLKCNKTLINIIKSFYFFIMHSVKYRSKLVFGSTVGENF